MSADYDGTEFIDDDFEQHRAPRAASVSTGAGLHRAPTREEVDGRVAEAHQKLSELKRAQEELEKERAALEEVRRRQVEFQTGRTEMLQNLTRGLGLLEEAEFDARREAEQMGKTVTELREALTKIQGIHEEAWTKENFGVELTRALTTLENARMEWNSARLKFSVLSAPAAEPVERAPVSDGVTLAPPFGTHSFGELCRLGFALTWPLALLGLGALGLLVALLLRR